MPPNMRALSLVRERGPDAAASRRTPNPKRRRAVTSPSGRSTPHGPPGFCRESFPAEHGVTSPMNLPARGLHACRRCLSPRAPCCSAQQSVNETPIPAKQTPISRKPTRNVRANRNTAARFGTTSHWCRHPTPKDLIGLLRRLASNSRLLRHCLKYYRARWPSHASIKIETAARRATKSRFVWCWVSVGRNILTSSTIATTSPSGRPAR